MPVLHICAVPALLYSCSDLHIRSDMVSFVVAATTCRFVSPQLTTAVDGAAPTFAFASTNADYLALQGTFTPVGTYQSCPTSEVANCLTLDSRWVAMLVPNSGSLHSNHRQRRHDKNMSSSIRIFNVYAPRLSDCYQQRASCCHLYAELSGTPWTKCFRTLQFHRHQAHN